MARSKKEAVAIKILAAAKALESAIHTLEQALVGFKPEQIRENPDLYKRSQALIQHKIELANIEKLFGTLKKKQGTRLILARCEGFLKEGGECDYKIRASMGCLMRGVPNCPDPLCNRKGKALTVEVSDEELNERVDETFAEV